MIANCLNSPLGSVSNHENILNKLRTSFNFTAQISAPLRQKIAHWIICSRNSFLKRHPVCGHEAKLFVVAASLLSLTGCLATVDPKKDTAPLTAKIRAITDGEYAEVSETFVDLGDTNAYLDVACTIEDKDGVQEGALTFSPVSFCGGEAGSFPFTPALDRLEKQTPDSSNQVREEITLITRVGPKDIKCTDSQNIKRAPYSATTTATCTGKNWSDGPNNSATSKLTIHFKDEPIK